MSDPDPADYHPDLPDALQLAPVLLREWSQQILKQDEIASTPTTPLYHYTGEDGLRGILSSQNLWCFSHLHQSDHSEFAYSLAIAREVMQEVKRSDDWVVKWFATCLEDLISNNSFTDVFEFYLFSVSSHRDDALQWKNFGAGGKGFAIGFSPAIFEPNRTTLNLNANENVFVGRVLYGEKAIRERHDHVIGGAASITAKFARENADAVKQVKPSTYLSAMAKELLADQLIWNCLTGKHERFKNECETRIMIMGVTPSFDGYRKVHAGKSFIESPLPLKVSNNIAEIIVGANCAVNAEKRLGQFLAANGYTYPIGIARGCTISHLPRLARIALTQGRACS